MGWFLRLKRPPCQEHRCKQVLFGRVKRRTQRDLKVPGERRKPQRGDLFSTPHRYTTIGMASAAKGLARRTGRSFAALRMTGRTPLKPAQRKRPHRYFSYHKLVNNISGSCCVFSTNNLRISGYIVVS